MCVGDLRFPHSTSGPPRICELDGEPILVELRRIRCDQAGEALACRVDDVQVTVGTVIPAEADIRAGGLIVGGVHLEQRGKREEAGK